MSAPAPVFPAPNFDPLTSTYPEGRWLRDVAKAGDWPAISGQLAQLTDPEAHNRAIGIVAGEAELSFLEEVAAREPTAPLPNTMLAVRLVRDGWEIRSSTWAKHVSKEQWQGFFAHLNRAEQILIEVTARHPDYVSAWDERLTTARGLSLGVAEARRRYDRLAKVAPQFFWAQSSMIQQLCPKWGGSYEAMHGFAVECTKASPPGSVNGALVAEAHLEHWLLVQRDEDKTAAIAYLKRPEVQQELLWAAGHSVLNPAFRPVIRWVYAHSAFAMAFSLAENYQAAAPHFHALYANGNVASESPWNYLGDAAEHFVIHRNLAFRKGLGW